MPADYILGFLPDQVREESCLFMLLWTPAFAGVTTWKAFYDFIIIDDVPT
jgi:hypothetical protein